MQYWIAIPIVAICIWGVLEIVKIGIRFAENIERIKHGYPTLDGTKKSAKETRGDYIDMTERDDRSNN